MDELFGDQLVLHALQDPLAAEAATGKGEMMEQVEDGRKFGIMVGTKCVELCDYISRLRFLSEDKYDQDGFLL